VALLVRNRDELKRHLLNRVAMLNGNVRTTPSADYADGLRQRIAGIEEALECVKAWEDHDQALVFDPAVLARPVDSLGITGRRIRRTFDRLGIVTVGDLLRHSAEDFLTARNFGEVSLRRLQAVLEAAGLSLAGDARQPA
jgi:DNA-directed RNA polymerase alpha subunit